MKKIFFTSLAILFSLIAMAQTTPPYLDETKDIETRVADALKRMTTEEKCRLVYAQGKFSSPGVPRLGIPELYMSDGPHGVRPEIQWDSWKHAGWTNDSVTAFPALTCLAATWNKTLAAEYGRSVGEEARYRKKDILLGPGVNIYRTPLNGRNFEYMGEDPFLDGTMATEYIKALQSNGVACCLKHFALNEQELYRYYIDVKVSDRALHEIYLKPFKMVIDSANPFSIMGSYNAYRGVQCSHNKYLINDILKGKWAYRGALISDWGGAHDGAQAMHYGLDIEMATYTDGLAGDPAEGYELYFLGREYRQKAANGTIPMSIVDDKAARVLRLIFQTAMRKDRPWGSINSPDHIATSRRIAEEGIVLLKNNAVRLKGTKTAAPLLPLKTNLFKNVLVVGDNATKPLCPGGGSSELKPKDEVSPLWALRERFGSVWNITYAQAYESGRAEYRIPEVSPTLQDSLFANAIAKAKDADLIIYIGGLNKNFGEDCESGDRHSYNMSYRQDELIQKLLDIQPNMVLVLVSGNAVAMPWLGRVPSVVQSWYLGSEAGRALASVLSGDVCPSGKTVFTYAANLLDYPAHQYGNYAYPGVRTPEVPAIFSSTNQRTISGLVASDSANANPKSAYLITNAEKLKKSIPAPFDATTTPIYTDWEDYNKTVVYAEDIFVGYRYFDQHKDKVVFPFGYGLSYTTFQYSDAKISASKITEGAKLIVTVNVKNTGKVEGKEVVQLYIGDEKASVARPIKELKAFEKVSLKPGETKQVRFEITTDDLKFYDEDAAEWRAEKGSFKAYVCASSADIKAELQFEM